MSTETTLTQPLTLPQAWLPTPQQWLLRTLGRLQHGRLYLHLGQQRYVLGHSDELHAQLHLHRPWRLALRCLTRGDLGFGEGYVAGDWDSDNPEAVLTLLLRNWSAFGKALDNRKLLRQPTNWLHKLRRNSLRNSRKNIAYHYDMGNDFYQAWLDASMTYSAAWFADPAMSLEQAQQAKYQRILNMLAGQPGQRILEIGCGWGGFAELAASQGYHVHGITLSTQQLAYAQQRLAAYSGQVQLELRDYRTVTGEYDHIVSIEMFEAVGEEYWDTYFATLQRHLRPGGRAALQIITIADACFATYRQRADFIQTYIFPGGMLPNPASLQRLIQQHGFHLRDKHHFSHDYARTLREWDARFVRALPQLQPLGYDQRFARLWRYYLAYCAAGFNEGWIDVVQLTLEKPSP